MPFFIENKKFPHPAWTKDNDGHGSLSDADLIDGYHFDDLEDRFVNYTGDQLTGNLEFNVERDAIADGCVLQYVFGEDTSPITDGSGEDNTLTLYGSTHKDESGYGAHKYHFNGSTDYGTTGEPFVLGDTFSIELIIAATHDSSWRGPIGDWRQTPTYNGWAIIRHPTSHYYYITTYDNGTSVTTWGTEKDDFVSGQTYHLVVTYDKEGGADNAKWYVDGSIDHAVTLAAKSFITDTSALQVGRYGDGVGHFSGYIFLVRIYDRVLTEDEVSTNYDIEKWRYGIGTREYKVGAIGNGLNWGANFTPLGFTLYDWRNTRNILNYTETANTLGIGNSGTGFTINGSTVGITSAAGISISGTTYDIDGTTYDIDGTTLTIDGSVSLTTTAPTTTINAATSVTISTPTINLNGSGSVVINGNRVLTVADKDVNSGIPQLDGSGNLQVKGNKAYLATSSNTFYLSNRTNTEDAFKLVRGASANIYTGAIQTASGTWSNILTTANINVANGVPSLNSENPPNLVFPGNYVGMTPSEIGNVHIRDSANNQWITYWHRNGPYNWRQFVNNGTTGDSWATVITTQDANSGTYGYTRYDSGWVGGGGSFVLNLGGQGYSYIYGGLSGAQWVRPLTVRHTGRSGTDIFIIEWDGSRYHAYVKHPGGCGSANCNATTGWHLLA